MSLEKKHATSLVKGFLREEGFWSTDNIKAVAERDEIKFVFPFLMSSTEGRVTSICTRNSLSLVVRTATGSEKNSLGTQESQVFVVKAQELIAAVAKHTSPFVRDLLKEWNAYKLAPSDARLQKSIVIAMELTNNPNLEGPYFNTSFLSRLGAGRYFSKLGEHRLLDSFCNTYTLLPAIIETIQDLGFRRIAFEGKGSSSLAFSGVADETGNGQLILLTPASEDYIPHPTMLPAKEKILVDREGLGVLVRVMPQLNIGNATKQHEQKLIELIEKSGLEVLVSDYFGKDIRKENIGLYSYTNDAGEKIEIPFILDWGAVLWPNGKKTSEEELKEWQERWNNMQELESWREAQRHMAKQGVQNVLTYDQLLNLYDFSEDTLQVEAFTKHGLYPNELGELSRIAIQMAMEDNRNEYSSCLRQLIESSNRSQKNIGSFIIKD